MKSATFFTSNIWLMFFCTVSGEMGEEKKIYFGYFNSQGLEPAGVILPLTQIHCPPKQDHLYLPAVWPLGHIILMAPCGCCPTKISNFHRIWKVGVQHDADPSSEGEEWDQSPTVRFHQHSRGRCVRLFPEQQSHMHRSLPGDICSYLVFFTGLLSA